MDLKELIRTIPDFPEPGILFRDITTVLKDPEGLRQSIDDISAKTASFDFDMIASPESRGFIYGVSVAYKLNKGFIPVRKAGKLPFDTISRSYDLEYGSAAVEIHKDAISPGQRVVIVDDLLATGGTCRAVADLINDAGGVVAGMVFLIELEALKGKELLKDFDVRCIVTY